MTGGALWLVPRGEGGGASCYYVSVSIYYNFWTFNEACGHTERIIHQDNNSFRINLTDVIMFFFIFNRRSQRSQTLQKHLSWYQNIRVQFWASVTQQVEYSSRIVSSAVLSLMLWWILESLQTVDTTYTTHTIIICLCEAVFPTRVL